MGVMNIGGAVAAIGKSLPMPGQMAVAQRRTTEAAVVTAVLVGLLIWLPLQTPLTLIAYQYLGVPVAAARGMLLLKDVVTAALLVYLAWRYLLHIRWRWFDWLAVAYAIILAIYAFVPMALGTDVSLAGTMTSLRQFILPLELYALGRLALLAGVNVGVLLTAFLAMSALAALFTIGTYLLLPVQFWASTMDLVSFIREVQGIPTAQSLVTISVVGNYGLGDPVERAVGPFTHPVGTGIYFVLPLLLSVSATFAALGRPKMNHALGWAAISLLFAVALILPISRGSWFAAGVGLLVCGIWLRRVRLAVLAAVATGAFLFLVPPFSYSIESALSLRDPSALGHQEAIERGVETVVDNPFGLGAGHGDSGFTRFEGDEGSAEVGENMYLALLVAVGPFGAIAFVGWMIGLILTLLSRPPSAAVRWVSVGGGAALAGLAITSLSSSPLMRFTTAASFWLMIGLLVAVSITSRTSPSDAESP